MSLAAAAGAAVVAAGPAALTLVSSAVSLMLELGPLPELLSEPPGRLFFDFRSGGARIGIALVGRR